MNLKQLFLNPFAECSEWKLLGAGIIGFILSSYMVYLAGEQFNGFFHFYKPDSPASYLAVLKVHGYMVAVPYVFLYGLGLVLNRKTRSIDVLNVILIAPFPLYFAGLLGHFLNQDKFTDQIHASIKNGDYTLSGVDSLQVLLFSLFGIVTLSLLIYQFYLLVKGMNVAVNNKKSWISVLFVALYFILDVLIQLYV